MASVDQNHLDVSTEWADFSQNSHAASSIDDQNNDKESDNLQPPILTLPLEHYKMIAEKVFISYLRSYRKLYTGQEGDEVQIENVFTLGNRLRAFLTVVIPSHADYGSAQYVDVTTRLSEISRQLGDYLRELDESEGSFSKDKGFPVGSEHTSSDQNFITSESPSFSSQGSSTIFGDLISEADSYSAKDFDYDSKLKWSISDEQTFCDSEDSTLDSTSMATGSFAYDDAFKVIRSSTNTSLDEGDHSVITGSFSDCSGFENNINWDSSSISVRGQIGIHYNDSLSHGDSDEFAESVNYTCEGKWNSDSSSCESVRTDFDTLINLWKSKERDNVATRQRNIDN